MSTERTTILLNDDDRWAVDVIRCYTGIQSRSAIIRDTLRERARAIEREKAAARERKKAETPASISVMEGVYASMEPRAQAEHEAMLAQLRDM